MLISLEMNYILTDSGERHYLINEDASPVCLSVRLLGRVELLLPDTNNSILG